jgi:hypothetical protein
MMDDVNPALEDTGQGYGFKARRQIIYGNIVLLLIQEIYTIAHFAISFYYLRIGSQDIQFDMLSE